MENLSEKKPPFIPPPINRFNSVQQNATTLKMVVLGDSNVGKTQLINALLDEDVATEVSRFFSMKSVQDDKYIYEMQTEDYGTVRLHVWDTVGDERAEYVPRNVFRDANGIIILYDVTNRDSFRNVTAKWLTRIQKELGDGGLGDDTDESVIMSRDNIFKILFVANKIDLISRREVTREQAIALTDAYKLPFIQLSSTSDKHDDIKLPFLILTDMLMPFFRTPNTARTRDNITLGGSPVKNTDDSTTCC